MTIEEIAQAIADNAKTGKWMSCTLQLDHPQAVGGSLAVGVKAFGKWVQRLECAGLCDGIPEQKTLKALKAEVVALLTGMVATLPPPAAEPFSATLLTVSAKIRDHLTTQRAKSIAANTCCYLDPATGNRCAVGCLFDEQTPTLVLEGHIVGEGKVFDEVVAALGRQGLAIPAQVEARDELRRLLRDWQAYHDNTFYATAEIPKPKIPHLSYISWLDGEEEQSPQAMHEVLFVENK